MALTVTRFRLLPQAFNVGGVMKDCCGSMPLPAA
jgi:hypothetical protein